jgi:hypothetical protein
LFLPEALPFETLHRGQEPRCLRLAIDHGAGSFRAGSVRALVKVGVLAGPPGRTPSGINAGPPAEFRPQARAPRGDRPTVLSIPLASPCCNR